MESFKFVVDPNKIGIESFKKFLKIDIITVIQYYCLRKILSENNVNIYDTYYINHRQFKLNGLNSDSYPEFYTLCNKYFDLYVYENGCKHYVSYDKLIDKFKEILLTDKFDDIINKYEINEFNALYTFIEYVHNLKTDTLLMYNYMYILDNIKSISVNLNSNSNNFFSNTSHNSFSISKTCSLKLVKDVCPFIPIIHHDTCILNLVNEHANHVIDNGNNIENTMSEHIVYTSDLEVTKQVIRNNQKIIANIVKNLKKETSVETSDSNKQKLMRLLTGEETRPEIKSEVKPKQRTKITL